MLPRGYGVQSVTVLPLLYYNFHMMVKARQEGGCLKSENLH